MADQPLSDRPDATGTKPKRDRRYRATARPDPTLWRLLRAAVVFQKVFDFPEGPYTKTDAYNREFMAADEESREAMLAYARSLDERTKERLLR